MWHVHLKATSLPVERHDLNKDKLLTGNVVQSSLKHCLTFRTDAKLPAFSSSVIMKHTYFLRGPGLNLNCKIRC